MRRTDYRSSGVVWAAWLAFALAFALCASVVAAQSANAQSAEVQYAASEPPEGGAAGTSCGRVVSEDDLLNAGDTVTYPGNFSVASGSSVVLDDADGSIGTLIDGQNAEISGDPRGDIRIVVSGDPINVSGANGVLNDTVCESIVASTGISSGQEADPGGASVLPFTGGIPLAYLGVLALGAGLVLLRRRYRGSRG